MIIHEIFIARSDFAQILPNVCLVIVVYKCMFSYCLTFTQLYHCLTVDNWMLYMHITHYVSYTFHILIYYKA